MRRKGPNGFTLIEMLAVVVIIGLLATVAIGKYQDMRDRAYRSAMKADLRNLATYEEIYYQDVGDFSYSNDLGVLQFVPSARVTVTVVEATNVGWSARATHAASAWSCALFIGDAAALAPASQTGKTDCSQP